MKTKSLFLWIIILLIFLFGILSYLSFRHSSYNTGDKLNFFVKCLKDKGAVFYGAFWCPHCRNQKAMFGDSADLLSYVECSTPDGQGQLPVCQEKNISGYPTWVFADGSRLTGEVPLETLAQKTGCVLPPKE